VSAAMSQARIFASSIDTHRPMNEQIPALVAELAAFGPEVIVAANPQNAVAVHTAAPKVPLLFISVADPVALGLVESLAHPGGNTTGFATNVPEDFTGRQLQFLKDLVPRASRIAMLANPTNPMHQRERAKLPEIRRALGIELMLVEGQAQISLRRLSKQHTRKVPKGYTCGAMRSLSAIRQRS